MGRASEEQRQMKKDSNLRAMDQVKLLRRKIRHSNSHS
jgi:hypothetical protein